MKLLRRKDLHLTDEEYNKIIDQLAKRAIDLMVGIAADQLRASLSKKMIEDATIGTDKPIMTSVTISIDQCVGDAVVEAVRIVRDRAVL